MHFQGSCVHSTHIFTFILSTFFHFAILLVIFCNTLLRLTSIFISPLRIHGLNNKYVWEQKENAQRSPEILRRNIFIVLTSIARANHTYRHWNILSKAIVYNDIQIFLNNAYSNIYLCTIIHYYTRTRTFVLRTYM